MFSVRNIFLTVVGLWLAGCNITVGSGSEFREAAVANGMPTLESIGRSNPSSATQELKPIVAFGLPGDLAECLNRLTRPAQLVAANDASLIAGGSCSFGKPRVAFKSFPADFHQSSRYIYPVVRINVLGDSATRYSHDGMFSRRDWNLVRESGPNACTRLQVAKYGGCLVPKRCETLLEFQASGQIATWSRDNGYVRRTAQCLSF